MPTEDTTPRPASTFVLDHGSIGYQLIPSTIDERWLEVVIEDDEVEVTLVTTPAKMVTMGLTIASMAAIRRTESGDALGGYELIEHDHIHRRLGRIEQLVEEILLQVRGAT